MNLTLEERTKVFDKVCRLVETKHFNPSMNGVDWNALAKNRRDQILASAEPETFEKEVQGLVAELKTSHTGFRAFAQEIRRSATDHYCVSLLGNSRGDVLHHGHHSIGIESLVAEGRTAFVAATPENLGQTVETAVHAFVAAPDGGRFHMSDAGNLFGQQVVPKFPTQLIGKLTGDLAATASVLALNRDNPEHGAS
jgi:hypothetical protein